MSQKVPLNETVPNQTEKNLYHRVDFGMDHSSINDF